MTKDKQEKDLEDQKAYQPPTSGQEDCHSVKPECTYSEKCTGCGKILRHDPDVGTEGHECVPPQAMEKCKCGKSKSVCAGLSGYCGNKPVGSKGSREQPQEEWLEDFMMKQLFHDKGSFMEWREHESTKWHPNWENVKSFISKLLLSSRASFQAEMVKELEGMKKDVHLKGEGYLCYPMWNECLEALISKYKQNDPNMEGEV